MKVQNLIDKIKEIAEDIPDNCATEAIAIVKACDNILLDWQIEQRSVYTLQDARDDIRVVQLIDLAHADLHYTYDEIDEILEQLHNGTRKE